MKKSGLSFLFMNEDGESKGDGEIEQRSAENFNSRENSAVMKDEEGKGDDDDRNYDDNVKNGKKNENGVCLFRMPLHYPRFTEKEYENMPENLLDLLLAAYGLPNNGELADKRRLAMGTFLWEKAAQYEEESSITSEIMEGKNNRVSVVADCFLLKFHRLRKFALTILSDTY